LPGNPFGTVAAPWHSPVESCDGILMRATQRVGTCHNRCYPSAWITCAGRDPGRIAATSRLMASNRPAALHTSLAFRIVVGADDLPGVRCASFNGSAELKWDMSRSEPVEPPKGRLDHLIPQGYLDGFTDPSTPGQIAVFDIGNQRWFESGTPRIAAIRGF